ncbi:hypothetical protein F4554_000868 [Actinopolymorpha rutila]|uniref:Uncharacterized protein n=1 Tax=Actinopolymorpha rutila TaxID=446787 RepID=A0A852ZGT2_9ACTN|nr:hypothetical protein [Actinopolymorpha rutila]
MNDLTRTPTPPASACSRCHDTGFVRAHADDPDGVTRIVEVSCPACCSSPGRLQDWRDSHHWSPRRLPCRHCGAATNLRAADGLPAHKVCAESAEPVEPAPIPDEVPGRLDQTPPPATRAVAEAQGRGR